MHEKPKDGVPYTLAFTNEVIDYLLMGHHFETCLSPGSMNFFSTISNAVDINKKVLYGKKENGDVVGRCLFVLDDLGQIKTFNRFHHDIAPGFAAAVDRYADTLAKSMNTNLDSSGQVPNLVASDWYDDGAMPVNSGLFNRNGEVDRAIQAAPIGNKMAAVLSLVSGSTIASRLHEVHKLVKNADCNQFANNYLKAMSLEPNLTLSQRIQLASFAFSVEQNHFISILIGAVKLKPCLLYTSPSPRDATLSRMPSSA